MEKFRVRGVDWKSTSLYVWQAVIGAANIRLIQETKDTYSCIYRYHPPPSFGAEWIGLPEFAAESAEVAASSAFDAVHLAISNLSSAFLECLARETAEANPVLEGDSG